MRTLVLGGNRYIGRHLVEELVRGGHEVTVFNSHESPLPPGVRRIHGDRRVPGVIEAVLGPVRDEFDAIYDNTSYQLPDVEPLVEIFRGRVRQYFFTSSTAVYLWSDVQPIAEESSVSDEDAVNPSRAYGAGKVRCERFLRTEYERSGLATTSFRVGHTMGPHSPLASREPVFFARLEQGRPILMPGDGLAALHLVHVDDVAAALAAALGKEATAGQVYNVAGPEFTSVAGYMRLMARVVGVEPKLVTIPREKAKEYRPPLVHWAEWYRGGAVFSIDKTRRDLAWEPRFGLEEGLADAYRWFCAEGRGWYEFDFSIDDAILATL
ncbi:MAG: NAD-dependent epimerase/dehydratase family protein [Dehalococcoidia bacterium]|nr:NAD-dependent epimerase/dehydratase family protein [Dehalococcoidia bacterium]